MSREILTMTKIIMSLKKDYPNWYANLRSTYYYSIAEISSVPSITHSFAKLKEKFNIGDQYEWISRFCKSQGISSMQLGLEKAASSKASSLLKGRVKPLSRSGETSFVLANELSEDDVIEVFRFYEFPLLETTKEEMYAISKECNFEHLMLMIWFCHTPRFGKPCGICNPCVSTAKENLGFRINRRIRFISYLLHPAKLYNL